MDLNFKLTLTSLWIAQTIISIHLKPIIFKNKSWSRKKDCSQYYFPKKQFLLRFYGGCNSNLIRSPVIKYLESLKVDYPLYVGGLSRTVCADAVWNVQKYIYRLNGKESDIWVLVGLIFLKIMMKHTMALKI